MVLRMYDHSVRYDFSQGKTNPSSSSVRRSITTTTTTAASAAAATTNHWSSRGRTTPTEQRRSTSWQTDNNNTIVSRRSSSSNINTSQRGSGFTVPPPYNPYVPSDELTVTTTYCHPPPKDHLELCANSPSEEEHRLHHTFQSWFSKRRRRHASSSPTSIPKEMVVIKSDNHWHSKTARFLAQLIPIVQFIDQLQTLWNQWLEFRLKQTAKRRISRALVNLKAAWEWNEQHAALATAATIVDETISETTTSTLSIEHPNRNADGSNTQWNLRDLVGDVGLALFSPLGDEAFEPLPVSHSVTNDSYQPPPAASSVAVEDCSTAQGEDFGKSPLPKTELDFQWEIVAREDDVAALTEEEDNTDEEDIDRTYAMLEEYPIEVVPEDPAELEACPRILTDEFLQQLVDEGLPDELKMNKWQRVFAIGRDGDSFLTMVDYCSHFRYTLVAMKTSNGHLLGGFASERWNSPPASSGGSYTNRRQSYYGTGQSFLFTSHPDIIAQQQKEKVSLRRSRSRGSNSQKNPLVAIFKWTGANEYCQICDVDKGTLAMGGGGAFGLIVEEDFNRGVTSSCCTFGNPCLIPDDNDGRFEIECFEVYGLIPWLTESSVGSSCGSSILLSSSPPIPSPGRRSSSCSLY